MKASEFNVKDLLKVVDLLKKLSFFKNNLALLVPIIIALVAALSFIPTTILSGGLRKTIQDQSVKMSNEIDGLAKKVDQAAEAEAMAPYINAYAQDANAMDDLIKQTTQRELLSYKLFPDMNETSPLLFDPFQQKFVSGVEALLQRLDAGGSPSDAEINAALDSSPTRSLYGRRSSAPKSSSSAYGGMPGQMRSFRMMTETDRKIVAKVCEDKAKAAKVYISPVDLGGYAYWSDWKFENWDKALKDCWYWQMAYWILEDVTATVEQMNKDSDTILRSPVKRVMGALFTQSRSGRSTIGGRTRRISPVAKDKQTPTYVAAVKNGMTGAPCTGRFCNETLDVMQFDVHVILNAADVMRFMQELCSAKTHKFRGWRGDQPEQTFQHNQISILESQITPVDREDRNHTGYEYGPDEVVDVDLICEYVFNKAAYEKIQPKLVLDDIANAKAPTARR
jgi:hypothetical protein